MNPPHRESRIIQGNLASRVTNEGTIVKMPDDPRPVKCTARVSREKKKEMIIHAHLKKIKTSIKF